MIEYYTFMHKGGEEVYKDNIFLNFAVELTVLIYCGSNNNELDKRIVDSMGNIISSSREVSFEDVVNNISQIVSDGAEYLVLRISDSEIQLEKYGNIVPYIVKNGELKMLPNGVYGLEDNDRIICGTSRFYKELSKTAILSDSLTAFSCEEWMDNLVCRISDRTMLASGNLTAVNFIVRKDD